MRFIFFLIIIGSSCTAPSTKSNMENTNIEKETIIKIHSSLPTPTPSTMAMFNLLEESGEYTLPNGETTTGELVLIYSTDGDHLPKHRVGVGSEFEMVGYRYRVVKIVHSENYKIASDQVWVEILGKVE